MTVTERDILRTLVELEKTVRLVPTADPKPDLLPLFVRIDQLARQLPKEADPTLSHYLHRKSYEKARLWLEGRDTENQAGSCRH